MSIILGVAMKNEQLEPLSGLNGPEVGGGARPGWAPGVTELLDHLAQELALEYVRLMEQAAEEEGSIPDEPKREEK